MLIVHKQRMWSLCRSAIDLGELFPQFCRFFTEHSTLAEPLGDSCQSVGWLSVTCAMGSLHRGDLCAFVASCELQAASGSDKSA